jgi:hypothetical protein
MEKVVYLMTPKKKKTIIIKDEKLRKIRNNLRKLWIIAAVTEKSKYTKLKKEAIEAGEKVEVLKELSDKWWEIEHPLRRSICECSICFKKDRDMVFNPHYKSWQCVKCYEFNHDLDPARFP